MLDGGNCLHELLTRVYVTKFLWIPNQNWGLPVCPGTGVLTGVLIAITWTILARARGEANVHAHAGCPPPLLPHAA